MFFICPSHNNGCYLYMYIQLLGFLFHPFQPFNFTCQTSQSGKQKLGALEKVIISKCIYCYLDYKLPLFP